MAMEDRGDKIVSLARELLRTNAVVPPATNTRHDITMSFKTLCLATLLTAFGSSAITQAAYDSRRPLNHYEKTEIAALLFYIARLKSVDESTLRQQLSQDLKITNLDDMDIGDFKRARLYLQTQVH